MRAAVQLRAYNVCLCAVQLVTRMQMLNKGCGVISWRLRGQLGALPIDIDIQSTFELDLITGRVSRDPSEPCSELSQANSVPAAHIPAWSLKTFWTKFDLITGRKKSRQSLVWSISKPYLQPMYQQGVYKTLRTESAAERRAVGLSQACSIRSPDLDVDC